MKAVVLIEDIVKGMGSVNRVITGRGQMAVLANVLIEARKEGVSLAATNLELGMRVEIGGKVIEEGAITIPARSLLEFVSSMGGTAELTTDGEKLKVVGGKFSGTFTGIAASEFPIMPRLGGGDKPRRKVKLAAKSVGEIASEIAYAAATDESRPVLTGIRMVVENENLVAAATDGFRLSKKVIGDAGKGWNEGGPLILPARTMVEVARAASEAGKSQEIVMEVMNENNQAVFGVGRTELVSRVLEGNFPDIDKIIPKDFKTKVIVDREELVRAVKAASVFARDSNNIIKLIVGEGKMVIKAAASQSGESEMELEAETEGEEMGIAFNFRYLSEFLGSLGVERVILKANGSLATGVWVGEGKEDLTHLIMPVRV